MNFELKAFDIFEKIRKSNNIIILTHINPDADAIGSCIGLLHIIKENFGKIARIVLNNDLQSDFTFMLSGIKKAIISDNQEEIIKTSDLIFILDLSNIERIGDIKGYLNNTTTRICIDHHINNDKIADIEVIDTEASSTGELIWKLSTQINNVKLNKEFAIAVYAAIMTDTGSFRYERTSSELHRIIADLIDLGAIPNKIYDALYSNQTIEAMHLLGRAYNSIELFCNGKVSVIPIATKDFEETGASENDTDGFASHALSIKGVEIGISIKEISYRDELRISLRSKGKYSVRYIAEKFNGGGHEFASGVRMKNTELKDAINILIREIEKSYFR